MGKAGTRECASNVNTIESVCSIMGTPRERKKEGPATCIGFLGMELDSVAMQVRLPAEKTGAPAATNA